jgi:hypothetical protein
MGAVATGVVPTRAVFTAVPVVTIVAIVPVVPVVAAVAIVTVVTVIAVVTVIVPVTAVVPVIAAMAVIPIGRTTVIAVPVIPAAIPVAAATVVAVAVVPGSVVVISPPGVDPVVGEVGGHEGAGLVVVGVAGLAEAVLAATMIAVVDRLVVAVVVGWLVSIARPPKGERDVGGADPEDRADLEPIVAGMRRARETWSKQRYTGKDCGHEHFAHGFANLLRVAISTIHASRATTGRQLSDATRCHLSRSASTFLEDAEARSSGTRALLAGRANLAETPPKP